MKEINVSNIFTLIFYLCSDILYVFFSCCNSMKYGFGITGSGLDRYLFFWVDINVSDFHEVHVTNIADYCSVFFILTDYLLVLVY